MVFIQIISNASHAHLSVILAKISKTAHHAKLILQVFINISIVDGAIISVRTHFMEIPQTFA